MDRSATVSLRGCVYSGSSRESSTCTRRRSRIDRPVVVSRATGRGYAPRIAAIPARERELARIGEDDGAVGGLAELPRAPHDRVEDGLLVGGGATDHAQ